MAGSESSVDKIPYRHMEIVQDLGVGDEAAEELAGELDNPLGLVKDHTYDGRWYLVRWHDEEQ